MEGWDGGGWGGWIIGGCREGKGEGERERGLELGLAWGGLGKSSLLCNGLRCQHNA